MRGMKQLLSLLVLVSMVVGQETEAEASEEKKNEAQAEAKTDEQHWEEYKRKFNKLYEDPKEDAKRKAIFLESKKTIEEHNAKFALKQTSFQMGYSDRTDWTREELHMAPLQQ